MKLPAHPKGGVQVGISDVLQWRDCARRMEFGMRRHEGPEPPESYSPANAYGSAIHLCLQMLDEGSTPAEAAQAAFRRYPQWLEPSDLSRLLEDMEKYLAREMLGVRTLLNEGEISIPLFVHPVVGQVWFRARIDRLYQSLSDPTHLIHVDYKSSRWAKSHEEVQADNQLWAYNLAIVEWFLDLYPEFDAVSLEQTYDQLRYGEIPTRKNDAQRAEMRRWLITAITAIIEDEVAAPSFNEWCPWCPLKMDCEVVRDQLTDWALTRIAALMPREERYNKDGSVSKRRGPVRLDPDRISEYVELLSDIKRAAAVLQGFDEELTKVLKEMPDSELVGLGRRKTERSKRAFSAEAKRRVIEEVGLPTFLAMCELSISAVERFYGDAKSPEASKITSLAEKQASYVVIENL